MKNYVIVWKITVHKLSLRQNIICFQFHTSMHNILIELLLILWHLKLFYILFYIFY